MTQSRMLRVPAKQISRVRTFASIKQILVFESLEVDVLSLAIYCLFFLFLAIVGMRGRSRWKQRGLLTGFIISLFAEMWGFPLSIFIITSLAGGGNLPYQFDNLMYYFTQPHSSSDIAFYNPPAAWLAEYAIARGVTLMALLPIINGWVHLKDNMNDGLVTSGPYAFSRNPQYIGFILFVAGMTLYWPTLITIPMGVALSIAYYWLARKEGSELANDFGERYHQYASRVPRFLGRQTYKVFRLPSRLNLTERVVEAALLIPFILWFGESVAGIAVGADLVRTYWFPIAYLIPVHIGVVISLVLFSAAGVASLVKRSSKAQK